MTVRAALERIEPVPTKTYVKNLVFVNCFENIGGFVISRPGRGFDVLLGKVQIGVFEGKAHHANELKRRRDGFDLSPEVPRNREVPKSSPMDSMRAHTFESGVAHQG